MLTWANAPGLPSHDAISGGATGLDSPVCALVGTKKAVQFDGTGAGLIASFSLPQPFTLCFLMRAATLADGPLIDAAEGQSPRPNIGMNTAGDVTMNAGGTPIIASAVLTAGTWANVVAVFDGANSSLTVNGSEFTGSVGAAGFATGLTFGANNDITGFANAALSQILVANQAASFFDRLSFAGYAGEFVRV